MFPVVPSTSLSLGRVPSTHPLPFSSPGQCSIMKQIRFYCSERTIKQNTGSDSVFAYEFLEKAALSDNTRSEDLLSHMPCGRVGLYKSTGGLLRPVTKSVTWMRNMRLAPDIYSHNAIIELTEDKLVRLRMLKNVAAGEEVITWFSEEISLLMNIPFLAPLNIVDNKCYTCHICKTAFETPNPLKIHLAIACGQQTIDILWIRLHHGSRAEDQPPPQEAFKIISSDVVNYHHHVYPPRTHHSMPTVASFGLLPVPQHISSTESASDLTVSTAAQLETLVSNMGTSKQGHLCIYCGKVYSRKYGLKIHIRTHTGFKPLKCKFCLRPFGDPSNLNKHVRLHMQTGNSIFKCHLCHKVMVRRRDLQRHLQTRHNENIFSLPKDTGSSSEDN